MHDIRAIRENPDAFDEGLRQRGVEPLAQALLALDDRRRGAIEKDWMSRALDMGRLIGMTDLATAEESYITSFRPAPTKV